MSDFTEQLRKHAAEWPTVYTSDRENRKLLVKAAERIERLEYFVRGCWDSWDCDEDSHAHGTECRRCEALEVLKGEDEEAKP